MSRSEPEWRLCDEVFAEFIEQLEETPKRRRRLWRERAIALPVTETLARAFEEKTEQMRRYLAVDRERWLAEQVKTA
ncbi:hypothetical protein NS234_19685 [Microbacterium oxydans]|uniref:hypothetical protein n=1 Tax=Microbacterium oxydans TaxID=82380 RepID=UPI000733F3C3|nr:hypothetical protein [Microbacterium oxydans]KTR73793.1 hypothetical protein NS234_19685 [Microbacterium oxydans]